MAVDDLTQDRLLSPDAVLTLGALVAKLLHEKRIVSLFLNEDGVVELCPDGELQLDGETEEAALGKLLDRGYGDEQLLAYLKGRKARTQR